MAILSDLPRRKLQKIVDSCGTEILSDARRCRAMLLDLCGSFRSEINIIEMALREQVASSLLNAPPGIPSMVVHGWLSRRLQEAYLIPESVADWAVQTCSYALRLPTVADEPRRFSSSLRLTVMSRPASSTMRGWQQLAQMPGGVDIPASHEIRLVARLDAQQLQQLAAELQMLGSVQALDLSYSEVDTAALEAVAALPGLTELDVSRTGLHDQALPALSSAVNLHSLSLWGCEDLTDAGLESLSKLASLHRLNIGRCHLVSDRGVAHLSLLSSLRTLGLVGTQTTDLGVAYLASLSALEHLELAETPVVGVGLHSLRGLQSLVELDLFRCVRLTNDGVARLRYLRNLQRLSLGACGQLTDAGLVHLRRMDALTHLSLEETDTTDAGLSLLDACIAMRHLDLSWTRTTDEGLARLMPLVGLVDLAVAGTQVGDAGLVHLNAFPDLRRLDLSYTRVTDQGLTALSSLSSLTELSLEGTRVTDAGLASLLDSASLSSIYLGGTQITDRGLEMLDGLASLRHLDLTGCEWVTPEGLAHVHPDVQVIL